MRRFTLILGLAVALFLGLPTDRDRQTDGPKTCRAQPPTSRRPPVARASAGTQVPTADSLASPGQPQPLETGRQESSPSRPPSFAAGNRYANRVLAILERRSSVVARIRHRVHVGEYTLIGSGRYWQQGVGNLRKTRLVLQTQVGNQSASLVQVFDGRYLWTDRQLPSGRKMTRLDPVRLQAGLTGGGSTITRLGRPTTATSLLSSAASRGSLCGQLADLIEQFEFEAPRQVALDGSPMVALIGQWKAADLKRAWPSGSGPTSSTNQVEKLGPPPALIATPEMLSQWPNQLPQHVLLLVGSQDLYPYLIEYRRADDARLATAPAGLLPAADPLARYEQFEVRFAAQIDSRLFEMASSDIQWTDETAQRIRQQQALGR